MLKSESKYMIFKVSDESLKEFIASYGSPLKSGMEIFSVSASAFNISTKCMECIEWLVVIKNKD